jgi:putative FmdB family regulatory protein
VFRYVYQCCPCGRQFELRRPVAERDEPAECPECQGAARRVFGAGILVARAPGWWNNWTGADLAPEPDKRPEFGRKSWPTTGYARPQENRGRF